MTTAQGIIDLRNELGVTQPQLAALLGVGFRSLCRWEVGGRLTPSVLSKLAKLATEKKVEHLANFFRSVHQAEIVSKINRLSTGGPRTISATELRQWEQTLSAAFDRMTYLLDSEKKSIAGPAFQLFREYLNYVEDVRGYIAYYAGAHDKTSGIVKPYGSFLQADEATKVAARKQPAKLGRSKKASKKATKSLS